MKNRSMNSEKYNSFIVWWWWVSFEDSNADLISQVPKKKTLGVIDTVLHQFRVKTEYLRSPKIMKEKLRSFLVRWYIESERTPVDNQV